MNLQSIIILVVIIALLIPAFKSTFAHMKGEGACCGGPKEKVKKKKISGEKKSEMALGIEGMHCSNCKNRIENHLNEIDGVIAKVSLEKKQVRITLYEDVPRQKLVDVIESLDFRVV